MNTLSLGILDIGLCEGNKTPLTVIDNTLQLSQEVDKLGFSRYWLGEHHEANIAWRNPDIIIPLIAQRTKDILISAAGVLMRYYDPLTIANSYKLLNSMFDKRVELGFSKGSVPPQIHEYFENNHRSVTSSIDDKCIEVREILRQGTGCYLR